MIVINITLDDKHLIHAISHPIIPSESSQIQLTNVNPPNGSGAGDAAADEPTASPPPDDPRRGADMIYGLDSTPPWYLCILLALQNYLTMIGAIVAIPFILTPALCMDDSDPDRGTIISTMIFVTGLVTWFQCTWGCRLPLVQGGTISFLVPTLAILNLPQWKCPAAADLALLGADEKTELWQLRMRELSGAIAVAAVVQVVMGYSGLIGRLLRYVTPLTIVPTVALVGLSLFRHAGQTAAAHWGVAAGTAGMLTLFSQVSSHRFFCGMDSTCAFWKFVIPWN